MAIVAGLLIVVTVGSTLSAVRFRGLNRALAGMNQSLESNLYFSEVDRAHREYLADNPGRAERLLDGCPLYLRGWEWHLLKRQCQTAILTLRGHTDYVFNVDFSPDGKTLASSSQDGTAKVWDATTGRLIHDLRGHSPDICWRVAYSPDGTMLVSGGRDQTVKIWDAASGRLIRTLRGHQGTVLSVAFCPVGQLLVSGDEQSVKLWDTKAWREIRTLPRGWHVAFSPDGRRLATVAMDLKIWDTATLVAGAGPVAPSSTVDTLFWRLAFSPDSRSLVTAEPGAAHVVVVLDAESGRRIRAPLSGHSDWIEDVAYRHDGRFIASASRDQTVRVWDAKAGDLLHTFRGHTDRVLGVVFDPSGRRLASASLDGTIKLWDVTKPGSPAVQVPRTLANPSGPTLDVMHRSDGRFFATIGGTERRRGNPACVEAVTVWDAKTCQESHTLRNPTATVCHDVAFDPRFERIAWANGDGTVEIRDATTSHLLRRLSGHTKLVWRMAYSPDGRRLASASIDGTVRVWDPATGSVIHVFRGLVKREFAPEERCLKFSADGHHLAMVGENPDQLHPGELRLWDAATGAQLPTPEGYFETPQSMAFDPREGRIAAAVGSEIRILEMASGRELLRLRGHNNQIGGMAFSPDGLRLVSAGKDGTVKVWAAATGREILTLLHGRGDPLTGVSISPDGWQIVSVGRSGTIKVWDATPLPQSPGT
jgi:WD40 repeat protein